MHYLKYMLLINTYYVMGAAVNTTLIAGESHILRAILRSTRKCWPNAFFALTSLIRFG